MRAIGYVKADVIGNSAEAKITAQMKCGLLARAGGFFLERMIVENRFEPVPYTLDEVLSLGPDILLTPDLRHIDHRAHDVLRRCDLLLGNPHGWYLRGYTGPIPDLPREAA